jgi:hypothetical protein
MPVPPNGGGAYIAKSGRFGYTVNRGSDPDEYSADYAEARWPEEA